jgi:hypothetical protein
MTTKQSESTKVKSIRYVYVPILDMNVGCSFDDVRKTQEKVVS